MKHDKNKDQQQNLQIRIYIYKQSKQISMNKISEQFKIQFMPTPTSPSYQYSTSPQKTNLNTINEASYYTGSSYQSSEDKFMMHFQSINHSDTKNSQKKLTKHQVHHQQLFIQKMQEYSSAPSHVDRIMTLQEIFIPYKNVQMQVQPTIVNLKTSIVQNVKKIQNFFNSTKQLNLRQSEMLHQNDEIPDFQHFSSYLCHLKSKQNLVKKPEKQQISEQRLHFPPKPPISFDSYQSNTHNEAKSDKEQITYVNKIRKSDQIILELARQKKMKKSESQYLRNIQEKLMNLLDYILKDQQDYHQMDSLTKMKEVLKNLEKFKGKVVDGESKINLLRIFFEEFKNLKQEKQAISERKHPTSMKSQNHLNSSVKTSSKKQISKEREIKTEIAVKKWGKKRQNRPTTFDHLHQYKQSSFSGKTSNKNKNSMVEDEWIGSID